MVLVSEIRAITEQALTWMVHVYMSSRQYQLLRQQAKILNCKFCPHYKVKESKTLYTSCCDYTNLSRNTCAVTYWPNNSSITSNPRGVWEIAIDKKCNISIIMKWGCDGMGQNRYKKRFPQQHFSDESFFFLVFLFLWICTAIRTIQNTLFGKILSLFH